MYKQINLGRVVKGQALVEMLPDYVFCAGVNGSHHEYYYLQGGELRKARFNLSGVLVSDYACSISFNNLSSKSMIVAGDVRKIPKTLSEQIEGTFEQATKNYTEVRCTHTYYTAVYGNENVTLAKFLEKLTNQFTSDDISEILNSKTFLIGVSHQQFKKLIKGEK
ncbi:hypothetical protein DIRTYBETTY_157 [Bacillus phage DirtyBetty]|uniref:Uncharacterized protein n=2 Tax=Wphvirus megatron TaxID=1987728 RepID=A0A1B1PAX5_9CAUD|nr:hypothetical protein QLX47_gp155 [Bacillus phage Eyuki]YP_009285099.1 hypothetical protein BIZ88_gp157 [Bacillus phage DirtyBetty]ALA46655.1 hypothetical protein EYUKI_155 [Bacillus phage Eyuki]ANT41302.1 hypothetical protein DIRTYBETTY_157 [Bacillus phage DirtyBetty]